MNMNMNIAMFDNDRTVPDLRAKRPRGDGGHDDHLFETVDDMLALTGASRFFPQYRASDAFRGVDEDFVLRTPDGTRFLVHRAVVVPRVPFLADMLEEPDVKRDVDAAGRLVVFLPDDTACLRHLLVAIYVASSQAGDDARAGGRLGRVVETPDRELRARAAMFPDGCIDLARKYRAWGAWMSRAVYRSVLGLCDPRIERPRVGKENEIAGEGDTAPEDLAWLVRMCCETVTPSSSPSPFARLLLRKRWANVDLWGAGFRAEAWARRALVGC